MMRSEDNLSQRAALVKQELLLALRALNAAPLDGSRDEQDIADLQQAIEHARNACDQVQTLRKRVQFYGQLETMLQPPSGNLKREEGSRFLISIMRLGVDAGFTVEEVRECVDQMRARLNQGA